MLSKTWGYAVRAKVRLAEIHDNPKARRLAGELAEETGMPSSFLSKVLQELANGGLIDSARGRNGGVRLAKPPDQITLYDIAKITDGFSSDRSLPSGFEDAPDKMTKVISRHWNPYHRSIVEFLAEITISTLAADLKDLQDS